MHDIITVHDKWPSFNITLAIKYLLCTFTHTNAHFNCCIALLVISVDKQDIKTLNYNKFITLPSGIVNFF